jgi:Uncharacterized conserved protein
MIPTVTLTTDFGEKDYYVALLKGHLLGAVPQLNIVDISHQIAPQDIMGGALFVKATYHHFPKETIHVVAINTFYAKGSRLIIFRCHDHYFIGPDNGIFSLILPDMDEADIFVLADQELKDIYEIIAQGVQGLSVNSPLKLLGTPATRFDRKIQLQPVVNGDQIRATIVHVDHFGNVIVNLTKETFERIRKRRNFMIFYQLKDPITRLSKKYNDVQIGDVCAFFNNIDLLEIAVHMGNAHELLSLNKNETIQIDFI